VAIPPGGDDDYPVIALDNARYRTCWLGDSALATSYSFLDLETGTYFDDKPDTLVIEAIYTCPGSAQKGGAGNLLRLFLHTAMSTTCALHSIAAILARTSPTWFCPIMTRCLPITTWWTGMKASVLFPSGVTSG
jgi:hypothetical protein